MPSHWIGDSCSILQEAVPRIIATYNSRYSPRLTAKVGEVLRTTLDQQAKYAQGRTAPGNIVTKTDGVKNLSAHQAQTFHGETCSHAVDINIFDEQGRYMGAGNDDWRYYVAFVGLAAANSVLSGGDWLTPDWPHIYCIYSRT